MIVTVVFLPTISVAASLKDRPTGTQPVQYSFSVRYSLTTTSSSLTSSDQGSMDFQLGLEIRSLLLIPKYICKRPIDPVVRQHNLFNILGEFTEKGLNHNWTVSGPLSSPSGNTCPITVSHLFRQNKKKCLRILNFLFHLQKPIVHSKIYLFRKHAIHSFSRFYF